MEYRRLGTSGLRVSSLCLGAMTFGQAAEKSFMHNASADEATSFAIMDRARELGINFIDTADVYGQDGLSERVTGRWLKERNARNDVIVATKMRFRMWDGPNGSGSSLSRRAVSSVIFGARTVAQVDDNAKAADVKLSDADIKALDDTSSFELGYPYDFIQRIQNRW